MNYISSLYFFKVHPLEFFQYSQSVQLLSRVWLFITPRTAACQASLSIINSRSLLKLMSIESVMPSNHLILFLPLLPHTFNFSQHQGLFKWVNSSIDSIAYIYVCQKLCRHWINKFINTTKTYSISSTRSRPCLCLLTSRYKCQFSERNPCEIPRRHKSPRIRLRKEARWRGGAGGQANNLNITW